MAITTQLIYALLNRYDSQSNLWNYYSSFIFGENNEITSLRKFFKSLPNTTHERELTIEELSNLIKIVSDIKSTKDKLQDDVFSALITEFGGVEKFNALKILQTKKQFTKEYHDIIMQHAHPEKAAKAIFHFNKYNSPLLKIKYGNVFSTTETLNLILTYQDPHLHLKNISTPIVAKTILEKTPWIRTYLETEILDKLEASINKNPHAVTYMLKKLALNKITITGTIFDIVMTHQNPKIITQAIYSLCTDRLIQNKKSLINEILLHCKACDKPDEFIRAILITSYARKLCTAIN